jgi:hypothetical protein
MSETTEPLANENDAPEPEHVDDWIGVVEAASLIPSPRPGKKTHASTVYRLMDDGKLRFWKRGRWRFASRKEVLALTTPGEPKDGQLATQSAPEPSAAQRRAAQSAAEQRLRAAGIW